MWVLKDKYRSLKAKIYSSEREVMSRNDLIVMLNLSVLFCKLEYILIDNTVE